MLVLVESYDSSKTKFSVSDSLNSKFTYFSKKYKYSDYNMMWYYTIIDKDTENYWITINGEKIELR